MLDLLSLARAARAISGETALVDLQRAILRVVRESTGAPYAALLDFSQSQGWVLLCQSESAQRTPAEVPPSVLHHAHSTRAPVVINDARAQAPFAQDEVVRARGLGPVQCHPLAHRERQHGLLYLELPPGGAPLEETRQSLLELLLLQAALALDNARLHQHLLERSHPQETSRRESQEARNQLQALLERANEQLEQRVAERTQQLHSAQRELLDRARHAGMAELASSILHNLGNALTGITVSSALLRERIQGLPIGSLDRLATLLDRPPEALGAFLCHDEKGQHVPEFVRKLGARFAEERQLLLEECAALAGKVEHANSVIATQQTYARSRITLRETLRLRDLVEDALRLSGLSEGFEEVIQREYGEEEPGLYERHVIMQILVNLLSNAKNALRERRDWLPPRITLRVEQDAQRTTVSVSDNGIGFDEHVKARLFTYGFTTRPQGHGFGLHSAALSAQSLGGHMEAHSEGPGKGARFELILPRRPEEPVP